MWLVKSCRLSQILALDAKYKHKLASRKSITISGVSRQNCASFWQSTTTPLDNTSTQFGRYLVHTSSKYSVVVRTLPASYSITVGFQLK